MERKFCHIAENKGNGCLTDKWIKSCKIIRQNTDSLPKMRKTVGVVIYHSSEAGSTETRH